MVCFWMRMFWRNSRGPAHLDYLLLVQYLSQYDDFNADTIWITKSWKYPYFKRSTWYWNADYTAESSNLDHSTKDYNHRISINIWRRKQKRGPWVGSYRPTKLSPFYPFFLPSLVEIGSVALVRKCFKFRHCILIKQIYNYLAFSYGCYVQLQTMSAT